MASLQAQAQQGNPQAIATLLQTTFPVQPIEIRANREGQGLMLSLSALDPLDQTATVQFIQASLNKLNPEGISALHVQAYTHGQAATSWEATIRLSAYTSANSQTPPQPTTSANSPAPDDTPTLSFTAGRTETSATHSPELEQQAILGNTEAIETILNQVFAQQPMLEQLAAQHPLQVSAYHEGQCLYLLLEAETAPEPEPCLIQIDRIISQWRSPRLQRLDVAGQAFSAAQPAWVQEFKVGTYTAQHPQAETTIVIPAPATNLPSRPPANARSTTQFSRQAYTSTQPEPATELDYTAAPSDLRPYYELLQLSPDASVDQLNQAYFNLRVEQRRQGNQEAIAQLKEAYHILKRQIQEQTYEGTRAASGITSSSLEADAAFTATGVPNSVPSAAQVSHSDEPEAPTSDAIAATTRLSHFLKVQELDARLSIRGDELHIGLLTKQHPKPTKPVARIFTLLESLNLAGMGLTKIRTVHVYGLSGPKQVVWQQQFAMPGRALNDAELDLLSFKNRHSTTIIFPALMAIAIFLNLWSIPRLLLQGIKIWFHEFG
ncbi:MAG: J domain-containing protein, partial [Cyanobacteria bacterium P01_H01_bin.121]